MTSYKRVPQDRPGVEQEEVRPLTYSSKGKLIFGGKPLQGVPRSCALVERPSEVAGRGETLV